MVVRSNESEGKKSAFPGLPRLNFTLGDPLPVLTLPALDGGRPRSISEFRGKKVVLLIFGSW